MTSVSLKHVSIPQWFNYVVIKNKGGNSHEWSKRHHERSKRCYASLLPDTQAAF